MVAYFFNSLLFIQNKSQEFIGSLELMGIIFFIWLQISQNVKPNAYGQNMCWLIILDDELKINSNKFRSKENIFACIVPSTHNNNIDDNESNQEFIIRGFCERPWTLLI